LARESEDPLAQIAAHHVPSRKGVAARKTETGDEYGVPGPLLSGPVSFWHLAEAAASMNRRSPALRAALPIVLIASVFAASWFARRAWSPAEDADIPPANYTRIVSLAPSVTESLCALGLRRRVVGVTIYCTYPTDVKTLPRIGGYNNPNCEAIVRLRPDLVVALPRHLEIARRLRRSGLRVLVIEESGITGIMRNLETLARVCRAGEAADRVIADLRGRMATLRKRTRGLAKPSVLVSVGRNMGDGGIRDVYAAGQEGFYDTMIDLAGGVNCYQEGAVKFPRLSPEGVIRLNPDVIIDMVDDPSRNGASPASIRKQWLELGAVSAVKKSRVHVMGGDHVVVPGPRFILILEEMAGLLHPELKREGK
jgi:cobalamin transport system substrate-binding protein